MWDNLITNDPADDYNLVIELWYNEVNCGIVKWNQVEEKYELIIYPNNDDLIIPCDMLQEILTELRRIKETRNM